MNNLPPNHTAPVIPLFGQKSPETLVPMHSVPPELAEHIHRTHTINAMAEFLAASAEVELQAETHPVPPLPLSPVAQSVMQSLSKYFNRKA